MKELKQKPQISRRGFIKVLSLAIGTSLSSPLLASSRAQKHGRGHV